MLKKFVVGTTSKSTLTVDSSIIEGFAELSGDKNPIHLDPAAAKSYGYPRQVAHGVLLTSLFSKMIGMDMPGPGALLLNHSAEWLSPVYVGDQVAMQLSLIHI